MYKDSNFFAYYNFMQPYIPYLSQHTGTYRKLLKKNQVFYWDDNMKTLFQKLKTLYFQGLQHPLQWYQRDHPVIIQADASKHGLGTYLLQNCKLIAFSLKSLTDAKTWYANIKRGLFAVVYIWEQLDTYLYCTAAHWQ